MKRFAISALALAIAGCAADGSMAPMGHREMGTLIGADLLNLTRLAEIGAPALSIGGAGTFDAVFLTGIIAGLLA